MDDASDIDELSLSGRLAAEREMAQRDQLLDDDALFYEEGDDEQVSAREWLLGRFHSNVIFSDEKGDVDQRLKRARKETKRWKRSPLIFWRT